eukprot:Skav217265  [mRNA]  locus=scaffold47:1406134:1406505:- [translate_table: standard]
MTVRAEDALAAPAPEEMAAPNDAPLDKKCDWCGKTFKKTSGLPTHQTSCDKKPEDWQEPKPKRQRKRHRPKQKQPLELEVEKLQEQLNKANEEVMLLTVVDSAGGLAAGHSNFEPTIPIEPLG